MNFLHPQIFPKMRKCVSPFFIRSFGSAVTYNQFGHPFDVLKLDKYESNTTKLGPKEVALKFLAVPINPADLTTIQGGYPIRPKEFPAIPGHEGVAQITAVGSEVKDLAVNDRVIPTTAGFGTWRTEAVAPSSNVMKISEKIKLEDAATIAVNPCTAYRMLEDFVALKEGDVIIQNGANSAVGQAVIQLAALKGVKTINVIRDTGDYEHVNQHLKNLGGTIVCTTDYLGSADFKRLLSDLPAPKLALNCVGGKSSLEIGRTLGKQGVHVTYGGMSRQPVIAGTGQLIFKDIALRGFWMSRWAMEASLEERRAMLSTIAKYIEEGKFHTWIETYKFSEFEDALVAVVNRTTKRKIVLLME